MKYSHNYNVILDNMDLNEYRLKPISAIMYLQDTFARLCGANRVAAFDLFAYNLIWVVGEFNIEFLSCTPFWSEELTVTIWISELTNLKIYTDYELSYKNKPFAKGNACWFLLNSETKRPVKTDILSDKFNVVEEYSLGEHKKFVLEPPQEKVNEISHKNNFSDIDFNDHVNNKSYLNIAEATVSKEFKNEYSLKSLYIKFNRESFLGDILNCSTYTTPVYNTYLHKIIKDGKNICDIQTSWIKRQSSNEQIVDFDLEVRNEK